MLPKTLRTISKARKKKEKRRRENIVGEDAGSLIISFQYLMHLKVAYTIPNDSYVNFNVPLPFERKKVNESSRSQLVVQKSPS